jgi:acetyl-CoA acyltransferase
VTSRPPVITALRRTPFGRYNGLLAGCHPARLLGDVWLELLAASPGVEPTDIDEVITGCVQQIGEQAYNVARTSWLWAGLPIEVPAVTVERQCTSSHQAAIFAAGLISSGMADAVAVGGVESLTRIPMRAPYSNGPGERYPEDFRRMFPIPPQGDSAEMIARKWGVTREEADQFALSSQQRAAKAADAGVLVDQLIPVDGQRVTRDEGLRDTSLEKLGNLKPVFDGVHTAGNSSQISDGASALLMTSAEFAEQRGLEPVLTLEASASAGADPVLMLTAVIPATRKLLQKTGLSVDDIAAFEVNEAFASVVLAWQRELGVPDEKVNPLGGAIAYGHPLGATGGRLIGSLAAGLSPGEYGIVTICGGGGVATASLFRRC